MNKLTEQQKLVLVRQLLQNEKAEEASELFSGIVPQNTVEYWLVKGHLEQKFQNWGEALNAFQNVLGLDAQNSEAENSRKLIHSIINFWNPELFNP
jgi:predicted sugar kinase